MMRNAQPDCAGPFVQIPLLTVSFLQWATGAGPG